MAIGTKIFSGTSSSTKAELSKNAETVRAIHLLNKEVAVSYFQVFNLPSASVTVGTTVPLFSIGVPASASMPLSFGDGQILGGSGLTIASTTTRAGSTTAGVDYNIFA